MLFEQIGGGCIMIGHLLFVLLRFTSRQVSYNRERDCAGKMGVGGFRCGLGGKEIVYFSVVLNSNSVFVFFRFGMAF